MIQNSSLLNQTTKKKAWTQQEDIDLIYLVGKHGPQKWTKLAESLPGRTGKQCRQRWHNHLDPNIKKQNWSDKQEWILFLSHKAKGNKWAQMTQYLIGRTDNSIKNHWNSTMQKKLVQMKIRLKKLFDNSQKVNELQEIQKRLFKIIQQSSSQDFFQNIQPIRQIITQQVIVAVKIIKKVQDLQQNMIFQQTARRQIKYTQDLQIKDQLTKKKKIRKQRQNKQKQNLNMFSRSPIKPRGFSFQSFSRMPTPITNNLFSAFVDENIHHNLNQIQKCSSNMDYLKTNTSFLSINQWQIFVKTPQNNKKQQNCRQHQMQRQNALQ